MSESMTQEETMDKPDVMEIPLTNQVRQRFNTFARWINIFGILTIIWGVINLISMITYKGNMLMLFPILGFTLFFIYLGTRLTSASAHVRQSVELNHGEYLLTGMDQLRLYFTLSVGFFIMLFIFVITIVFIIAAFGTALENFPV